MAIEFADLFGVTGCRWWVAVDADYCGGAHDLEDDDDPLWVAGRSLWHLAHPPRQSCTANRCEG